jgi:hypothetical protein
MPPRTTLDRERYCVNRTAPIVERTAVAAADRERARTEGKEHTSDYVTDPREDVSRDMPGEGGPLPARGFDDGHA